MIRAFCIAPLMLGFSGILFAEDSTRDELKKFEGTWQLVSATADGGKLDEGFVKKRRMVIKDGKSLEYFGDKVVADDVSIELDPAALPKKITLTDAIGRKTLGIYKLEGDKLTRCIGNFNEPRPEEFVSKSGTRQTLQIYERVKD